MRAKSFLSLLMAAVIIIALLLFFGRSFLEGMQYRTANLKERAESKKKL